MKLPAVISVTLNRLSPPEGQGRVDGDARRPSHHLNDTQSLFKNPWPSYRHPGNAEYRDSWGWLWRSSPPSNASKLIPQQVPDWGAAAPPDTLKATWLGHAGFLVELPTPPNASRGPRILLDPVFSYRCSPFKWFGPARYTPTPCKLEELPQVDIVAVSHKHYDHLDAPTLREMAYPKNVSQQNPVPQVHIFMPLNNEAPIELPHTHYHCLDWWESADIVVDLPAKESGPSDIHKTSVRTTFRLTCTPSQHQTALTLRSGDTWPSLWSSWAIESSPKPSDTTSPPATESKSNEKTPARNVKVWFAGDTGYRTVHIGENESDVPVCPAFTEIGERLEGFDLALLPIGAYKPRGLLSCIHCSPSDAVRLFSDIKAKKAVAMHWGTWNLGSEPFDEPVELLKQECEKAGVKPGEFEPCAIGATVIV